MTAAVEFVTTAWKSFRLSDVPNAHYVDVLVRPQEGHLHAGGGGEFVSPLAFLTGVRNERSMALVPWAAAESPSINLVVGTYGVGKTELMHQLCHYLRECGVRFQTPAPLPVNLALCHALMPLLDRRLPPSGPEFARLLFDHLLNDSAGTDLEGEILPAIRGGDLFVILDGLDELAATSTHHMNFFSGLASMLIPDDAITPRFRIAISLRHEYLSGVDRDGGKDLVAALRQAWSGNSVPVTFLHLDLFNDSHVKAYMDRRGLGEAWVRKISQHRALLTMLYRPLLLRIFCDLALNPETQHLLDNLARYREAAQLIEDYVRRASSDSEITRARDLMETGFEWDLDAMARQCLRCYRDGVEELGTDDLRLMLRPSPARPLSPPERPSDSDVWRSIHKCPFFKRTERGVRFAHRSFLEYFVARGVSLDMREGTAEFSAFDELVLNVDTRKFLKSMMDDREWYTRTRRSYGLDHPSQWTNLTPELSQELDKERQSLLDSMTVPEQARDEAQSQQVRAAVAGFLSRDHDQLHPRYLTYNCEAVAVFLKNNWWNEDIEPLKNSFADLLRRRLDNAIAELQSGGGLPELRSGRELLIERILSIAQRLRYSWVQEYRDYGSPFADRPPLLDLIENASTRGRVKSVLEEIGRTFFVAVKVDQLTT